MGDTIRKAQKYTVIAAVILIIGLVLGGYAIGTKSIYLFLLSIIILICGDVQYTYALLLDEINKIKEEVEE